MAKGSPNVRFAEIDHEGDGLRVHVVLGLDGASRRDVSCGVPTLEGLMADLARAAAFDVGLQVDAEPGMDPHRVATAVGGAFGTALRSALDDSDSVVGVGSSAVPAGEALVMAATDVRALAHASIDLPFQHESVAGLDGEAVVALFRAMAWRGGLALHVRRIAGEGDRDIAQAAFRATGAALRNAVQPLDRWSR